MVGNTLQICIDIYIEQFKIRLLVLDNEILGSAFYTDFLII